MKFGTLLLIIITFGTLLFIIMQSPSPGVSLDTTQFEGIFADCFDATTARTAAVLCAKTIKEIETQPEFDKKGNRVSISNRCKRSLCDENTAFSDIPELACFYTKSELQSLEELGLTKIRQFANMADQWEFDPQSEYHLHEISNDSVRIPTHIIKQCCQLTNKIVRVISTREMVTVLEENDIPIKDRNTRKSVVDGLTSVLYDDTERNQEGCSCQNGWGPSCCWSHGKVEQEPVPFFFNGELSFDSPDNGSAFSIFVIGSGLMYPATPVPDDSLQDGAEKFTLDACVLEDGTPGYTMKDNNVHIRKQGEPFYPIIYRKEQAEAMKLANKVKITEIGATGTTITWAKAWVDGTILVGLLQYHVCLCTIEGRAFGHLFSVPEKRDQKANGGEQTIPPMHAILRFHCPLEGSPTCNHVFYNKGGVVASSSVPTDGMSNLGPLARGAELMVLAVDHYKLKNKIFRKRHPCRIIVHALDPFFEPRKSAHGDFFLSRAGIYKGYLALHDALGNSLDSVLNMGNMSSISIHTNTCDAKLPVAQMRTYDYDLDMIQNASYHNRENHASRTSIGMDHGLVSRHRAVLLTGNLSLNLTSQNLYTDVFKKFILLLKVLLLNRFNDATS